MKVRRTVGLVAVVLGLTCVPTVCYVGVQGLQEDLHMRPGSPLAWLFVDERLWALDPPAPCERIAYYSTIGDGPKLPGSDTTLRCQLEPAAADRWARGFLAAVGFVPTLHETPWVAGAEPTLAYETDEQTASIEVVESVPGSVVVRIGVWHKPQ